MSPCIYRTLTSERWKLCRHGGMVALCRCPSRQHPNCPPFDPAGYHSERVLDDNGVIQTEYTRVKSTYCTPQHCTNYQGEGEAEARAEAEAESKGVGTNETRGIRDS